MKMRWLFKASAILLAFGYCSLLIYYNAATRYNVEKVSYLSFQPVNDKYKRSIKKDITLDDLFISVKTSVLYQNTRLPIILKTWFQLAKEQTWFFTDTDNYQLQNQTNGHMVNTKCPATHQRKDLCCKTAVEYDYYLESDKKWFCHFDDDNYVNVPRLVSFLQVYNPKEDWYLGRTSIRKPVKMLYKDNKKKKVCSFWFATGGAGYCISRSLALKMFPLASGGRFISICEKKRLTDDVAMGFIIEHLLMKKLRVVNEFHSHLELLKTLDPRTFHEQISFGYSNNDGKLNVLNITGFDNRHDPTSITFAAA